MDELVNDPHVTVSIVEFRTQPVSILGAVKQPGVHQLQGEKNLFEVLSTAGGLREDAGYSVRITRRLEWGKLPLPDAVNDPSGEYSTASVSVKAIMEGRNPQLNITIKPQDVISVPKGEMVYVIGSVKKSGGFVLGEKENVSVLQALSMAEG
jgi:polysaccharide export outer membrane protein